VERTGASIVAALILAGVVVSGCGGAGHESLGAPPVRIAHIPGTNSFARLVLSPDADARIGIQTARAGTKVVPGGARRVVVPYAAVLYDANGVPSLYTSSAPRVYFRRPIRIDHIAGNVAILRQGPAAGTAVVVVGAEELFGAETGVQGP
jgi:hypothetical protein